MPTHHEIFIQSTLNVMRATFKRDDARCHYCGSLVDITTNQRDAFVIICPECGALGASNNDPLIPYSLLRRSGTIVTKQRREAMSRGQSIPYTNEGW